MRSFVIAVTLAPVLSAGCNAVAQVPAQATPAQPASPPVAAPAAPAPTSQSTAPFPLGAKIAFVDFQRIAQDSSEGKASSTKIQALIEKKQNEGAGKTNQLQSNQQRLQQSGGVMSDPARALLQKEIERQQVEVQRFQQDAQAEINELQTELQTEFQKKLVPLLRQVAQEKGVQLLLSQADAGIAWGDPGLDLTSEVVKKLDAVTVKSATTSNQ